MDTARITWIASILVTAAGAQWGLYWVPVRALADAGLGGAAGSLVIAIVAGALLVPVIVYRRYPLHTASAIGAIATAVGGSAFMLYSVGIVQARVAVVILLFYLTPVWTTLITRFIFGHAVHPIRYAVIVIGLVGLFLTLGRGGLIPLPQRTGEWYALLAGLLWSIASIGMNARNNLPAVESTFMFVIGALITAGLLFCIAPTTPNHPAALLTLPTAAWTLAAATLWWIGPMIAIVWATARLEPTRVGILLMSEVLVGVVSAALFANESLAPIQVAGGALLITAAVLDVVSDRLVKAAD